MGVLVQGRSRPFDELVFRPRSHDKRPTARGAGAAGHVRQGSRDHAARVRYPVAAGLHPEPRGPSPAGGNGSLRPLPHAPDGPLRGASAAVANMTSQTER